MRDFCLQHKGTISEVLATGIVNSAQKVGLPVIPPMIEQTFVRANKWLK